VWTIASNNNGSKFGEWFDYQHRNIITCHNTLQRITTSKRLIRTKQQLNSTGNIVAQLDTNHLLWSIENSRPFLANQSSRKGLKRMIKPHNCSHTIDEPRTRMNPTQQPRVRFETDLNEILKTGPVTENPQSSTLNWPKEQNEPLVVQYLTQEQGSTMKKNPYSQRNYQHERRQM
jgi:hypothetical protein